MEETITVAEVTAQANFRGLRVPEGVDPGSRLYTGFSVNAAGHEWKAIVTAFDGTATTAYLTHCGFDMAHHGPAVHAVRGRTACHRRVVREWFRERCGAELRFA